MKDYCDYKDSCLSGQTIRQTAARALDWVQAHYWDYEQEEHLRLRQSLQNRQSCILLAELVQLFFENSDHTADAYCTCLDLAVRLYLDVCT